VKGHAWVGFLVGWVPLTTYGGDVTLACLMTRIGVLYRPHVERAKVLAQSIQAQLTHHGVPSWLGSAWNETDAMRQMPGTTLVIGIGGDGTLLHCARVTAACGIPVLGVKLGQLGFITELNESDVECLLPRVLSGEGWIEERTMLRVAVGTERLLALNDAVVRCTAVRLIDVAFEVDHEHVTTYRADGVIVATATGSTAYSLAAGGPVLVPEATDMVVQSVCSHIGLRHALVLPRHAVISLRVDRQDGIVLSLDGQIERELHHNEQVVVTASEHKARFLRLRPATYFLGTLHEKLGGTRT
jgi:NAD+ kinase